MLTYDDLDKLSASELKELNGMVIDVIKSRRDVNGQAIKRKLKVGMEVTLDNDSRTWVVTKINIKRAECHVKGQPHNVYTVPFNMIQLP